ncbi:MAG TPA: DMT family transporter [Nitrososphaerales archaeon]|nr:DMT family transporter [Nitrososphaerales archaeon]
MISIAIVLGLALAFCFGTSDYLSKGLTGSVGFYRTTVYTLATSGALVFVPLLFLGVPGLPSYSGVALLGLISVSTFTAFLFMYRGYQKGHLSVVSPTVNSFPIFSVLFAVFVLKIVLSYEVLLALGGVILGILLVSTNVSALGSSRGRSLTPGVPEAILAAFFFAVGFTSLGYAEETVGYFLPVVAARLGAASIGLLAGLALKQDLRPIRGKPFLRLLAMGALEAGGLLAFTLALFYSSSIAVLPITTTLAGMGVVFTVGYALILLKEKVGPNYAVGILILIASVATLLYLTA